MAGQAPARLARKSLRSLSRLRTSSRRVSSARPICRSVELVPGSNSRLIAGEQSMISFLKMDKHSYFAPHRHHQEQIMIVLEGYCDEIIEGKLYRVQKGDVIILPSNIEHGAYIYDEDVHVIDVFGEVRADYMVKLLQVMATLNKKK